MRSVPTKSEGAIRSRSQTVKSKGVKSKGSGFAGEVKGCDSKSKSNGEVEGCDSKSKSNGEVEGLWTLGAISL